MARAQAEPVLLVVDFKNQVYRATAAHPSLFSGRTFTGGLYGFMAAVLRAVRDVRATAVVVATDSPPYLRSKQFKAYKGDRKGKTSEEHEILIKKGALSMQLAKELLEVMRIPLWAVDGFEFDDLCAWAVDRYHHRFERIVAMSNDSDLYQLFDVPKFVLYKGADKLYTREDFEQEFGALSRDEWVAVLSMTGTHNAVPGIHGIGPKTALKAIKAPEHLEKIRAQHGRVIERNRRLIRLPHDLLPEDPGLRIARHAFSPRDVIRFCSRYEIMVTERMAEAIQDLRHIDEQ